MNIMAQIPSPAKSMIGVDGEVGMIMAAGGAGFVRCASCSFGDCSFGDSLLASETGFALSVDT